MQLLDEKTEEAVGLLTRLAFGNVALVRDALARHGDDSVEAVMDFIVKKRGDPPRPVAQKATRSDASKSL
jgi:hypothetical protein